MSNISKKIQEYAYALALWTDKADFITDKTADIQEDKLLEIRYFDEEGEFRAYRSLIDDDFKTREIRNNDATYADGYYDEAQYLDIDSSRTKEKNDGFTYATGGGKYHLPNDAKMLLTRTYYKFDEDGVARKYDWRLVGFTNEEKREERGKK